MTTVSFKPYDQITIRSYMRYQSPQQFADGLTISVNRTMGGRTSPLFWANGVLFRHFPLGTADSISKEYLSGHLPMDHIEFAPMPQYHNEIRSGEIIVPILDVSNHTVFNAIARWIVETILNQPSKEKGAQK